MKHLQQIGRAAALALCLTLCLALAACGSQSRAAVEKIYGVWCYPDGDEAYDIREGGEWDAYGLDGVYRGTYDYRYANDVLTLIFGTEEITRDLTPDGEDLIDNQGFTLTRYTLPTTAADPGDTGDAVPTLADFYGTWKYENYDQILSI